MANGQVRIADGQLDFSDGIDSSRAATIASANLPHGLPRNSLAWANNATMRNGGVLQRTGWVKITTIHDSTGIFQGGWVYETPSGLPYIIAAISGRFYRIRVDTDNSIQDITGPTFPATEPYYHFVQGEEFMIVQAGDLVTLPLFWDGASFRQSNGLSGSPKELPAAGPMVYLHGRVMYGQFRIYTGGDIVRGPSGTPPGSTSSILRVTENPLAIGGDGFAVPTQAGNIRALQYAANIDATLGQGLLYIFTRKQVYSLDVPITRADWISITLAGQNTPATQRIVQFNNGSPSDRCIVQVNSDLFYQSLTPSIQSLFTAIKYFNQWGNRPISANIQRVLDFSDRSLMQYSSGVQFENRLYESILQEQRPQGVVSRALAVMDFQPISTLGETSPPIFQGIDEGLDWLQLFTGDFGGRERMFATVVSREDSSIELWEFTNDHRFDNVDTRVNWYVETPAYTWGHEFDLKRLDGGEIWMDKVFGQVDVKVYYREDANPCWKLWHVARFCTARTSCETVDDPVCYPTEPLREGGKFPITLPAPPLPECDNQNSRPTNIAHQFQLKIEVTGWSRIRGIIVYAVPVLKEPYQGLQCVPGPLSLQP